jgi:hypothetical protein
MSDDRDNNSQNDNQQNIGGSSGGGNLPKPDPDLSDYYRRDGGDNPHIVKR